MRTLDPRLAARLESGATTLCRCWRLDRRDGVCLGFTDHDNDLTFDDIVFAAASGVTGTAQESATGLAPGSAGVAGALSSASLREADVAAGLWDGARLRRWVVDWHEPEVRALLFDGTLGEIACAGGTFRAEALGPAAALNRPMGRAFLRSCDATLGDARCRADLARPGLRAAGVVVAVLGSGRFEAAIPIAAGFVGGTLVWTSGANAGTRSDIASDLARAAGRRFALAVPPRAPVVAGDGFEAMAGCDRSFACCRDRFGNAENFRGFPHLPGDDFVLGAAEPGV